MSFLDPKMYEALSSFKIAVLYATYVPVLVWDRGGKKTKICMKIKRKVKENRRLKGVVPVILLYLGHEP
jgi:hypothetical protein